MHIMVLVVQVDLSEKLVRIFLQCGREVARAAATPCNASLLAYTFLEAHASLVLALSVTPSSVCPYFHIL